MSEQNQTPDMNEGIEKAKEAAQIIGSSVKARVDENVDTEKIGKHARTISDRVQLFVMDNKLEVGAVVVFTAGFWMGRRVLARRFLKYLQEQKQGYLPLALTEKQVEKMLKAAKKGVDIGVIFNTEQGDFVVKLLSNHDS